jgi:hypothetical protein
LIILRLGKTNAIFATAFILESYIYITAHNDSLKLTQCKLRCKEVSVPPRTCLWAFLYLWKCSRNTREYESIIPVNGKVVEEKNEHVWSF